MGKTGTPPTMIISVITINYNTGLAVERTIASVLGQTAAFEWVIIDGGSSDGSRAALRAALRPGDHYVSEPDRGIGDAFNKGLALAGGDWVLFMNAGDAFADPGALATLADVWDGKARWIAGRAQVVHEDGRPVFVRRDSPVVDPRSLVQHGNRIFHQAVLAQRSLLTELGGFATALRVSMDYDLWVRWIAAGHAPQLITSEICQFRLGGTSADTVLRYREELGVRRLAGLVNPHLVEVRLALVARLKSWTPSWVRWPFMYRLKERLRW